MTFLSQRCLARFNASGRAIASAVRPIPTTNGDSLPIHDDDEDFSFHEDPTDHSAATPHHPDPDNYDDLENLPDVDKDAFRRWMAGLAAPRLLAGLMPFSVMR
ncbi:protein disulfide isomerase-like 1-4 [Pyrus ussuriensis x Pyrus communis]|uniref:Protein disulfide isomerase-like 1-4 n=1 Tax=Pyrus ussuriensis x Pyrus communis TaxID=2448454 RepID=A0A5N5HCR7_9ROSA|nr:protein disulfide isomerase-like 1-4 [Pyrus ussuriensis x Pyrus communis]